MKRIIDRTSAERKVVVVLSSVRGWASAPSMKVSSCARPSSGVPVRGQPEAAWQAVMYSSARFSPEAMSSEWTWARVSEGSRAESRIIVPARSGKDWM